MVGPLAAAVDDYIARYRHAAGRELAYFRRLRTDEDAVRQAALARLPSGKRHPHQRRIPRASLEESARRLLGNLPVLRRASSFDELFDLIEASIRPIPKIGELTVYDTALRIGARFGLGGIGDIRPRTNTRHRDRPLRLGLAGREAGSSLVRGFRSR